MPTFDVVLHTNAGMFRDNAQRLLSSFPPIKDRVELGAGLWVGPLDGDLPNVLMDTCEPQLYGIPQPTRQYAQFYAYVHEVDNNAELYQWDTDLRLQRCVALSRLIHPTTVGFRYAARIRHDSQSDSTKIVPAEIHGISVDVYLPQSHERDWLTKAEAELLAHLVAVAEPLQQPAVPPRVSRALWYFDYAQRTYYADLRWTLVATALEALVHTGKKGNTRHFTRRVPALATEVCALPLTTHEAELSYEFRSRLSHGDGFLSDMPTADIRLYEKLEEVLRLTILKAFREPVFATVFTDDARIATRWPV